jgi:hypothetical protein
MTLQEMRDKIKAMYLDYANNFLMVGYFAEHYHITTEKAYRIISLGRKLNNGRR